MMVKLVSGIQVLLVSVMVTVYYSSVNIMW